MSVLDDMLDEIKRRVEPTMCPTYSARHPEGIEEGRISRADWDTILAMLEDRAPSAKEKLN